MRIGVLTGGADVPGLNAAIRAVVRRAAQYGFEVSAIRNGWAGLLGTGDVHPLTTNAVSGILPLGGTILGTSRTNPFHRDPLVDQALALLSGASDPNIQSAVTSLEKYQAAHVNDHVQEILANTRKYGIEAVVAIGGRDTLDVAHRLAQLGVKVVGVPKSLDNDLVETEYSIGFDSAVTRVMHALDDLHSTAAAHQRVMVVEAMGRETGWVAMVGGLAGGADYIIIPEVPVTLAEVCAHLKQRHEAGNNFSVVVVAEGATITDLPLPQTDTRDPFGRLRYDRRGIGERLAVEIEARTGYETRHVVLGHLQRGGSPSVFDRVLASRLGVVAVDMVKASTFDHMVVQRNNEIGSVPLAKVVGKMQQADKHYYDLAKIFFGPRRRSPGKSPVKRIGVLTGGGDCPGLNPGIRAVVHRAWEYGWEVFGFRNGWAGLLGEGDGAPLTLADVAGSLTKGGTLLGTSRTNPAKKPEYMEQVKNNLRKYGIDALVAIGGDDTLGVAAKLAAQGVPVVGMPKTMDNDISETDYTFGFDSACTMAVDALDRLHTTATSHHRAIVVEVMGREAGWVAVYSGLAGGADFIFIKEVPTTLEECGKHLLFRKSLGKSSSIVVVAEGAIIPDLPKEEKDETGTAKVDAFGHVRLDKRGLAERVAEALEKNTGIETRFVVLGHLQRGGSPTAFDRLLATRAGVFAVDQVKEGHFGVMSALRGNKIVAVELAKAVGVNRQVEPSLYELAKVFF